MSKPRILRREGDLTRLRASLHLRAEPWSGSANTCVRRIRRATVFFRRTVVQGSDGGISEAAGLLLFSGSRGVTLQISLHRPSPRPASYMNPKDEIEKIKLYKVFVGQRKRARDGEEEERVERPKRGQHGHKGQFGITLSETARAELERARNNQHSHTQQNQVKVRREQGRGRGCLARPLAVLVELEGLEVILIGEGVLERELRLQRTRPFTAQRESRQSLNEEKYKRSLKKRGDRARGGGAGGVREEGKTSSRSASPTPPTPRPALHSSHYRPTVIQPIPRERDAAA